MEISYIRSYENFGISVAWLDQSDENAAKHTQCNVTVTDTVAEANKKLQGRGTAENPQLLNAIWKEQVSVPVAELLEIFLKEGEKKTLHICLTPRNDGREGTEYKFKLLGVRVY